jgi:hypothetical protein
MKQAPYIAVASDLREGQTVINKAKDLPWTNAAIPWIATDVDIEEADFDTCDYMVLVDPPPLPTWVPDNLIQPLKTAVANEDYASIIDAARAIVEAI